MGIIEYKSNKKLLIIILVASLFLNACAVTQPELKPTTTKKIDEVSLAELVKTTSRVDLLLFLSDGSKIQGKYDGFTEDSAESDSSDNILSGKIHFMTSGEIRKIHSNDILKIFIQTEHQNLGNVAQNVAKIYVSAVAIFTGALVALLLLGIIFQGCAITCE